MCLKTKNVQSSQQSKEIQNSKKKIRKFVIDYYTYKLQPYWVTGQYWVS